MNHRLLLFAMAVCAAVHPLDAADPAAGPILQSVPPKPDEPVAVVNGKAIKRKDLDDRVQRALTQYGEAGKNLPVAQLKVLEAAELDQIITRELVLQAAGKSVATNLDTRVQAQIDRIKTQFGGDEGMTKALQTQGLTVDRLRTEMRDDLIVRDSLNGLVDGQIKIADDEIKTFYDSNRDRFQRPEMAKASHILIMVPADAPDKVKAEKKAKIEAARERVKKGDKFADVAREVSEDPGSAPKGGDLGEFPRGAMVPEFDKAAFELKLNEMSDIITTQFGYHILIVTDRQPTRLVPLEEAKLNIEQFLKQRKGNAIVQQYVKDLQAKAKIDRLLK